MATIRVSDETNKLVSHYAVKNGKTMAQVNDDIVRAGLAALSAPGDPAEPIAEDRATLLSRALRNITIDGPDGEAGALAVIDAETARWNASKRGANQQRTRVETVLAALTTAVNRWAAANRYERSRG